jgi:hypothetical protein
MDKGISKTCDITDIGQHLQEVVQQNDGHIEQVLNWMRFSRNSASATENYVTFDA